MYKDPNLKWKGRILVEQKNGTSREMLSFVPSGENLTLMDI